MDALQKAIHLLEVGGGMRYLRWGLIALGLLLLVGAYDLRGYKNLSTLEAMDAAQLARNIADGKGYSTLFVRPLSMHLIKRCTEGGGSGQANYLADSAKVRDMHPDISNPPVYPLFLAGLMSVLPFQYEIPDKPQAFWNLDGKFARYEPDFLIALFNQILFLLLVTSVFFLARRLFDKRVALFSALLLLGTELLWRFSVSGLSTMLLLLIFTGVLWCLVLFEEETGEPKWGRAGTFGLPALCGVLVGIGALTRYSFGWLILPVVLFVISLVGKRQRFILGLVTVLSFLVVLGPWVYRNYAVSGLPFGTATYSVIEGTPQFPEYHLQRSFAPDFSHVDLLRNCRDKLLTGVRQLVQSDFTKLGGSWITAFFIVGLLISYQHPPVRRLRYFLVGSLALLTLVQALGRTHLSEDSPDINSENLLILLAPMVIVYAVSMFYLLLDQIRLPFREVRYAALGVFGGFASLPLILTLLPIARPLPLAFPPYYPPGIQESTQWVRKGEMMMSDIPWAVAWYGNTQCAWLTTAPQTDFFAINDYHKSVESIMLSYVTLDSHHFTEFSAGWGKMANFVQMDQIITELVISRIRQSGLANVINLNPLLGDARAILGHDLVAPDQWPRPINVPTGVAGGGASTLPFRYWQRSGLPYYWLFTTRPNRQDSN